MTAPLGSDFTVGVPFGAARRWPSLESAGSPAEALDAALRPAFARGPTFVSFSGGRDSSAVLAAATSLARREGFDDPVPITIRAAHAPHSDEREWQEQVIAHLGVEEWLRIEVTDELDAVGPYAARVLEQHGLLWPFNAHFHLPMLDAAAGGTLFTGVGGDELWYGSRAPNEGPRRRILRLAPFPLRRALLGRRQPLDFPWLRPAGRRAAAREAGAQAALEPSGVTARMRYLGTMRAKAVGLAALDLVAATAAATICHPLYDPRLWGSLAALAPRKGFSDRESALRLVAGHALPEAIVARRTKAHFDEVFFTRHAREFAERWSGAGVPDDLVDADALRAHWLGGQPDSHSFTLLQLAWLASSRDRVEQAVGGGRE